ncbi:hypothetical protein JG678_07880, partial [Campylobacter sp. 2018MI35]|nr:hypothetical protein [Campylobacter sp. 2018MI35]
MTAALGTINNFSKNLRLSVSGIAMDFALPPGLARWQLRVREFVEQELQPHDAAVEQTGVVPE